MEHNPDSNIIKAKKTLINKEAAEIQIINRGGDDLEIIPVEKITDNEEIIKRRNKIIDTIMSSNQSEESKDLLIPEPIRNIVKKMKSVNDKIMNEYIVKKDLIGLFKNELLVNIEDLTNEELDFVYQIFSLSSNVSMKEYDEFGLEKGTDPEMLEYVSITPFNPDTEIYLPPIYESIKKDRIHIDIQRKDLNEDYQEIYDQLMNEDEIAGEIIIKNKNKEISNTEINHYEEEKIDNSDDFLPDDFVLIANGGELPVILNNNHEEYIENMINKKYEEFVNESNKTENESDNLVNEFEKKNLKEIKENKNKSVKEEYVPSYKFITKEESELLNKRFKEVENEYNDNIVKDENVKKTISKDNKLLLNDALEEMKEKYYNKNKVNLEDNNIEIDYSENDEEEYEEFEDEYDDKFCDFDKLEKDALKQKDGVDLLSKDNFKSFLDKLNPEFEKIDKNKKGKSKEVDLNKNFLTIEELNILNTDEAVMKKNLELLSEYAERISAEEALKIQNEENNNNTENPKKRLIKYNKINEKNSEPEYYVIHVPKQYQNILTSIANDKKTFEPKKIGIKSKKFNAKEKEEFYKARDLKNEESKQLNERENNEDVQKPELVNELTNVENNLELNKKDRKKLVKQENKERREKKKKMKEEFKSEKLKIQKNISNANKVMRVGLSVKEL